MERVPGCVPVKVERKLERFGTRMEREWNANGTQMEREWNANGTHLRTRSGRVPNAFSVRLFLSSTVVAIIKQSKNWNSFLNINVITQDFGSVVIQRLGGYLGMDLK